MNIIFVSTEFVTKLKPSTGLPNYLYRMAKALQKRKHRVIVVSCGEYDEHTFYNGIELYRITVNTYSSKNSILDYLLYAIHNSWNLNKKVNTICRHEKIDIIQYTSLGGTALFYTANVPAVVRLSSYAKTYYGSNNTFSKEYVNAMSKIELLAAKRVKGVYSPSYVMAKGFAKDAHRKVAIIETMFENDVSYMDTSVYKEKLYNKKYILFFGSLYAEKGIFVIAKILEKVLLEDEQLYFVFVGTPKIINNKNPIKELTEQAGKVKDKLIFINALPHNKLYPIIENAYIVTLPSIMENFSNAAIEAMYFGSIVVATDGTSFEQLIRDGKNGFLTIPGNSESLYKGIQKALKLTKEERQKMSLYAKQRIKKLSPNYMVKKLIKYFEYSIQK